MKEIPLVTAAPASVPPAQAGLALWNLGFRPFYLLASLFAAASVALWAAQFSGLLPGYLAGPLWHGHEMIFGYTSAVIAGFLLTAVQAWTQQPTASGKPLMALAALWLAGRLLLLTPWALAAMLVNAAFPLALAVAIAVPLWRARNRRNYFFVGLLAIFSALTVIVHLTLGGSLDWSPQQGLQLALDVVLFVMVVLGGRVIPMFTNNALPGTNATRHALLEKLALGSVIAAFVADLLPAPSLLVAALAIGGALANGCRLALWKPWRTLATPLLWVLHAAYAWIVVYLFLRGLTALDLLSGSYAAHALTVGAIGGMTIGMMTRTARGHTGRPLRADRWEIAMYLSMHAAALVRVFGGIASPQFYLVSIEVSALLWAACFALYALRYWPVLSRPRLDGKPG